MSIFVGRERELAILQGLFEKTVASLVVIKGRRRIGKSTLLQHFGKNLKTYIFTGIPPTPKTTAESQHEEFTRQMSRLFNLPVIKFEDWGDIFWFLADKVKKGKIILVFDEISWIGSKDPDFLGKLKTAWDMNFKKNDRFMFVLCGSVSAWIEKNILRSTGFVGRISSTISLNELSLEECNFFWRDKNKNISAYEKFKLLAITGGIPRYLEEIRPSLSAEINIKDMCFSPEGFLFNEFDQIFSDIFLVRSEIYKKIILLLVERSLSASEICKYLNVTLNRVVSDYLEELVQAGFISRDYSWHIADKKISKLSYYRLKDNYIRFYLKYIFPHRDKIISGAFQYKNISLLPGFSTIMGYQFENLVLNNRRKIWDILRISPDEIVWDNPFFQTKRVDREACQIDYLIQTRFGCLYVCEVKFSAQEIKKDIIKELQEKIEKLKKPKGISCRPVLIHVNGLQDSILEEDYFSNIIDFEDLLK